MERTAGPSVFIEVILTHHLGEENGAIKTAILESIKPGFRAVERLDVLNGTRPELESLCFTRLYLRFLRNNDLLGEICEAEKLKFSEGEIQRLWNLPLEERESSSNWRAIEDYMCSTAQKQQVLHLEQELIRDIMQKKHGTTINFVAENKQA